MKTIYGTDLARQIGFRLCCREEEHRECSCRWCEHFVAIHEDPQDMSSEIVRYDCKKCGCAICEAEDPDQPGLGVVDLYRCDFYEDDQERDQLIQKLVQAQKDAEAKKAPKEAEAPAENGTKIGLLPVILIVLLIIWFIWFRG